MSISKAISLDFSDGVNTVYTRSASINMPFEVSHIRVANVYMALNVVSKMNGTITSNLVDNDVLTMTKQLTSTNPIKHYFNIPRPINGTYDFTMNLSNTLNTFSTTSRVGYKLVGTLTFAIDPHTINIDLVNSPDSGYIDIVGTDSIIGKIIRTGVGITMGSDAFTITNYNTITGAMTVFEAGIVNIVAGAFRMEGNLLTISVGATNLIKEGSVTLSYGQTDTVIQNLTPSIKRLSRSFISDVGGDPIPLIDFTTPSIYKYYNLTKCEILIDLEFYPKRDESIKREIEIFQYFLWSSSNLSDIKNIDVLFPVDELQIVNTDCLTIYTPDIFGFGSDLVSSSTLSNENFLAFNVFESSNYQVNKKKWVFNQPKIFSGAYKIFAKSMLSNTTFDLTAAGGVFYIQFLFIKYKNLS